MALVTYIEHNGTEHHAEIANGDTVMQGAVNNAIEGIVAECGGGLARRSAAPGLLRHRDHRGPPPAQGRCAVGGRNADAGLFAQWGQPGQPIELPDHHQ